MPNAAIVALCVGMTSLGASRAAAFQRRVMDHAPSWSPDGAWIAFDSNREGTTSIYVIGVDGTGLRRLTNTTDPASAPHWAPNGARIHFLSGPGHARRPLSVAVDGTDIRPEPKDSILAVAKNGGRLFESSDREGSNTIFSIDASGTVRQLTTGVHAEQASFSPDDSLIVYEERPRIGVPSLVVMRADGSWPTRIVHGTDPSWSPDGRTILFKIRQSSEGPFQVAVIAPDGSGLRVLVEGVLMRFSPDGTRIAYMAPDSRGDARIWTIASLGGDRRCITCPHP